jgi:hypothetical protein
MHQPFYFRAPGYHYTLRSNMAYGWWTGVISGERQLLHSAGAVVIFNRAGELLQVEATESYPIPPDWCENPRASASVRPAWAVDLDFDECPIRVLRFWVPERWLGIEDMPDILAEYFTNPEVSYSHGDVRPEDGANWKESDQFVFRCGCGDYWLNSRGDVK